MRFEGNPPTVVRQLQPLAALGIIQFGRSQEPAVGRAWEWSHAAKPNLRDLALRAAQCRDDVNASSSSLAENSDKGDSTSIWRPGKILAVMRPRGQPHSFPSPINFT